MLPTDSPRTEHLCVNVDRPSDDRAIKLDISASVGVKARCCHSPGLRYHSFSTVGGFKVQGERESVFWFRTWSFLTTWL